jgi:hypothetical protein
MAAVRHWWRGWGSPRPESAPNPATSEPDYQHAKLMVRRMERLGLEPEELMLTEPVLFQELQAACSLCPCPELCALALMNETEDPAWQDWRDYCPNATRLTMLGTLQSCCRKSDEKARRLPVNPAA